MSLCKINFALVAATALASHAASAQSAWYIGGSAGALLMSDLSRTTSFVNFSNGTKSPATNASTFNPGEALDISVGHALPMGFRAEAELGYLLYTADSDSPQSSFVSVLNGTKLSSPAGGDHDRVTATLNLFYDLPVAFALLKPYVGGGVGVYHASASDAVFTLANAGTFTAHGSSGNNAMLFGEIGAAYALTPPTLGGARLSLYRVLRDARPPGRAHRQSWPPLRILTHPAAPSRSALPMADPRPWS